MRSFRKHLYVLAVCLLMAILALPGLQVKAAGPIDTDARAELTVVFTPNDEAAPGVKFRLYKVADVSFACEFTVAEKFSSYGFSLEEPTAESWASLSNLLPGYIAADAIEPDRTAVTDAEGKAAFEDLPIGLYLVVGDVYHGYRQYVTPYPYMVCLPDRNPDDSWQYEVESHVKPSFRPDAEPVELDVLKIWKDNGSTLRPKEITVELYDGNELFDTVILSKENNWQYHWSDLYGGTSWSVKEKVPSGYTVSMEQQGDRIVITNTKVKPPPWDPELPQTGVLWWPVPVLLAAGLILILIGVLRRRSVRV